MFLVGYPVSIILHEAGLENGFEKPGFLKV